MIPKTKRVKVIGLLMVAALSFCFLANTYRTPKLRQQEPVSVAEIVLNAPKKAEVGELVRFDLTGSTGQAYKWLMVPATVDFEVFCEGQLTVFSARKPGTYMFIIGCAHNGTIDIVTHIVTITGPSNPDIYSPEIVEPAEGSSLDKWIPYWCSINKRPQAEADLLASSFNNVAAQIAAQVLQQPTEIIQATADANRAALGKSLPGWKPVLRQIQVEIRAQADQGELTTPEQHRKLWIKIAEGLRAYATLK